MTDIRADQFEGAVGRPAGGERERERVEAENRRLADERKKIVRDGPKLTGAKLAARADTSKLQTAFTALLVLVAIYTAARALPALI